MTLQPLQDRLLIRASEPEDTTSGGIIIPDTAKEKPQQGEIVAVGKGKVEEGKLIEMTVKVGDKVLYGKYAGTEVAVNNEDLLIMRESDLFAIIND